MNNFFVTLKNRGLIHIEGDDRHGFLQNLVSNDMDLLEKQDSLYACLLTAQGKFLHDFFILKGNGFYLLDCEGGQRAQDLYQRLEKYKLRTKVQISVEDHNNVYAVFGDRPDASTADPRHEIMGWRCFEKPAGMEEHRQEEWDRHRISLCIPDGTRDMIPEKSTLLECNIDKLNGISFEKGCYVGQELTARMHHRGLAKKHLYVVEGQQLPPPGTDIKSRDGKLIGEMRSHSGNLGLALLKDDAKENLAPGIAIC